MTDNNFEKSQCNSNDMTTCLPLNPVQNPFPIRLLGEFGEILIMENYMLLKKVSSESNGYPINGYQCVKKNCKASAIIMYRDGKLENSTRTMHNHLKLSDWDLESKVSRYFLKQKYSERNSITGIFCTLVPYSNERRLIMNNNLLSYVKTNLNDTHLYRCVNLNCNNSVTLDRGKNFIIRFNLSHIHLDMERHEMVKRLRRRINPVICKDFDKYLNKSVYEICMMHGSKSILVYKPDIEINPHLTPSITPLSQVSDINQSFSTTEFCSSCPTTSANSRVNEQNIQDMPIDEQVIESSHNSRHIIDENIKIMLAEQVLEVEVPSSPGIDDLDPKETKDQSNHENEKVNSEKDFQIYNKKN